MQLAPLVHLLLQTIDVIQEKDQQMIFAEPVDFDEVCFCFSLENINVYIHPSVCEWVYAYVVVG